MNTQSIYQYQKPVFEALCATARVFFGYSWRSLAVRPRFSRFVSGPTGSGKSHIVREVASTMGVPLLQLCASAWIPVGASRRGAEVTYSEIANFCSRHDRGIIFLDELDKIRGDSTWLDATRPEIFSLLDGIFPDYALSSEEDQCAWADECEREEIACRLAEGMLCIGAGAFQPAWEQQTGVLGFHSNGSNTTPRVNHSAMSSEIPREIVNRFVSPVLCLPSLGEEDYLAMLDEAVVDLPTTLAQTVRRVALVSLDEAIKTALGARWIQQSLLHALIEVESSTERRLAVPDLEL